MKLWSKEDDKKLVENHGRLPTKELGLLLNRTDSSIESRIRRLGIGKYRIWTIKEDGLLRQHYSFRDKNLLVGTLERSWRGIVHRAEKLGLKRPKSSNYSNIDFFDSWSDDMSYILGFIAADGGISKKPSGNKALTIGLSTKDIKHLERIKDLLAPNKKLYTYFNKASNGKCYECCRLSVGSDYMCDKIISIGIGYRKSSNLKFPDIPKEYLRHFIRGYFDGDGSIYKRKKYSAWNLDFVGSESFLVSLSDIINKNFGINKRKLGKKINTEKVKNIRYTTQQAEVILDWLYEDSSLFLKRKHDEYIKMKNRPNKRKNKYIVGA